MKSLKMFAIGLAAMAAMTMGVHATGSVPTGADGCLMPGDDGYSATASTKCIVKINNKYYKSFGTAWTTEQVETKGADITLLADVTSGMTGTFTLAKNVTIDLGSYDLTIAASRFVVSNEVTLKITGTGSIINPVVGSAFEVNQGGELITEGKLALTSTNSSDLINVNGGKVTIGDGAELTASTNIISVKNHGSVVELNATVGTKDVPVSTTVVNMSSLGTVGRTETAASITISGGSYYTTGRTLDVKGGATVIINDGTLYSKNAAAVVVTKGDVTINEGNFTSEGTNTTAILSSGEGSLTINGGTAKSKTFNAVHMSSNKVTNKITNGTFIGGVDSNKKQYAALFITDSLLTGLAEDGEEDVFTNIVSGGKYYVQIIGEAKVNGVKYSADDVTKHIVVDDKDITEDGKYKVVGTTATDPGQTPDTPNTGDDANTPGTTTPNTPQTGDSIMTFMGLGLASIAVVGLGAKNLKKQNN